ncbi:MAG: SEC-C domain-containing protein [Gammaproteobacteria bacterium]|nr:SEC-C domain-containing protein [Gammaproteobacteria bacterium]
MSKIGRNEKCPCGSGKKYKRCHGSIVHLEQLHPAIAQMQRRAEAAHVQRQRQQGLGKPIISAETSSGHRLVAVKNRLLHSKGWKTFHDFLSDYIKMALDPEWGNAELAKPPEERHPILNWYQKLCAHQKTFITKQGTVASAPMTGAVAAYMHLAYDLYALDHNAELQKKLVARLRNLDNFEGARYEVFVAAMLIRAGFEIEFENEDDRSTSHCEFTATFTKTGRKFSVEAKHRAGARLRMGRLLTGALAKHAAHLRIVFIDINLPDDGSEPEGAANMNSAIRKLRAFEGKFINGQPLPSAYLIVTNTPWEHHLDSSSFRCGLDIDGFQIPDFKANVTTTLRAAIEARDHHIEMHELIQSIKDHSDIPSTFDGEIPEFAFDEDVPRLLIGQNYLVQD